MVEPIRHGSVALLLSAAKIRISASMRNPCKSACRPCPLAAAKCCSRGVPVVSRKRRLARQPGTPSKDDVRGCCLALLSLPQGGKITRGRRQPSPGVTASRHPLPLRQLCRSGPAPSPYTIKDVAGGESLRAQPHHLHFPKISGPPNYNGHARQPHFQQMRSSSLP